MDYKNYFEIARSKGIFFNDAYEMLSCLLDTTFDEDIQDTELYVECRKYAYTITTVSDIYKGIIRVLLNRWR